MKTSAFRAMRIGAVVALAVGCAAGEPGPGIDVDRALATAKAITDRGPRPVRSESAQAIAGMIAGELAALGVPVERTRVGEVAIPEIVVLGVRHRGARRVSVADDNVIARFGPLAGEALLIMAHYDSVPGSPGAVDNAAAVATLLELARVLAAAPPPAPVMLAFTAGEEIGLVGAEALAEQRGAEVGLAISLDLIGGDGALSLNGASTLIGGAELGWLAAAAERAGVVVRAPLAHRVISRWWPQAERSDHGAFTRRGIRALHLYHRGHDGELIDRAYHTPHDDFARIDRASVAELGRLLHALAYAPPPPPDGDGFWVPAMNNTVVPRWPVVVAELVLGGLALVLLVRLRHPRARGGLGLVAGGVAVALAFGVTYVLEQATSGTHPAPWLHAPRYHVIALALVVAGVLGLVTRLAARFAPWSGAHRYLAVAIALPLAVGAFWLAIGAAELAWIWLVPAACAALAPKLGRLRWLAVVAALLPLVLVLDPDQLREAAWNGFAPVSIPLVAWLGVTGLPVIAIAAWALRHGSPSGPLGTFVLSLGWALATILGILMLVCAEPPCTALQFHDFHLACETLPRVR